ncbi:MAG: ISAzo13 family transposase, partial [Leptolyngbya foveolarum]
MVTAYPRTIEAQMQRYYRSLSEKDRRRYAGIEAAKLGHGGIRYISSLLRCDYRTVKFGMTELSNELPLALGRARQAGGGRKSAFEKLPELDKTFLKVLSEHTAGSPMDEKVKWTNLNRPEIAALLKAAGLTVSVTVVDQLLKKHHYHRRRAQKTLATGSHPQR